MRAVIQRVKRAAVDVAGETVGQIGPGLLCFLGICRSDTAEDAEYVARKVLNGRFFANAGEDRGFNRSVTNLDLEILVVSQFTLVRVVASFPHRTRTVRSTRRVCLVTVEPTDARLADTI